MLDEPTNDLDLSSLRLLEEALANFPGCILAVSHDRYFLNRICTGVLTFSGEGELFYTPGDYDYALEKRSFCKDLQWREQLRSVTQCSYCLDKT